MSAPALSCSVQVMLARWLDYRGEESRQALLWGFLNARFQTGLRNLLDGAILQTGGAVWCSLNHAMLAWCIYSALAQL